MSGPGAAATMPCMSASLELTRRTLIEVSTATDSPSSDPVLRRYRLARVALYTRFDPVLDRFAHLRRSHD